MRVEIENNLVVILDLKEKPWIVHRDSLPEKLNSSNIKEVIAAENKRLTTNYQLAAQKGDDEAKSNAWELLREFHNRFV